ncbi:hypothetical protein PHMEG_00032578 [Phytophthora megakarya]|uniref:Reverse transcriptase RNase H-like domain-containing protein n=1 Tax=Phytophthora megakarya TaxID=4795 RepID=A0A225UVA5_9STRA|nr:hypothetical protein PHMEG_00032578 [Phytophthora megakarya]
MREGLVDYIRTVRASQELLDTALHRSRHSKRAAAGIKIDFLSAERTSFEEVKALLSHSATLAYPDPLKQLCLFTDASDTGWGLVVTQVSKWRPDTPIQDQPHELLICMGGTFTGSALNSSVIEKDSYPLVHACERLGYLLLRVQGFKIYCDHRNIIHLFAPSKELKKHVRGKLLRWSTKLLEYRYTIEHIEDVNNVWADVISRWGGKVCRSASMATANRVTTRKWKRQQEREREADEHRGPRPGRSWV